MDINNKLKFNDLFDLYGCLLTQKQQEILKLFYVDDFGLSEIAEILGISRQGVFDAISISEKILLEFDNKMNLLNKHKAIKKQINECLKILTENPQNANEVISKLNGILLNL